MNTASQDPVFAIQRTYLKDLSLEIPGAPQIFLEQNAPTVEIQLDALLRTLRDRVVEAHALDVAAVTRAAAVGDDDVVEGALLGAATGKANLDHCGFSVLPSGRNGRVSRQV